MAGYGQPSLAELLQGLLQSRQGGRDYRIEVGEPQIEEPRYRVEVGEPQIESNGLQVAVGEPRIERALSEILKEPQSGQMRVSLPGEMPYEAQMVQGGQDPRMRARQMVQQSGPAQALDQVTGQMRQPGSSIPVEEIQRRVAEGRLSPEAAKRIIERLAVARR